MAPHHDGRADVPQPHLSVASTGGDRPPVRAECRRVHVSEWPRRYATTSPVVGLQTRAVRAMPAVKTSDPSHIPAGVQDEAAMGRRGALHTSSPSACRYPRGAIVRRGEELAAVGRRRRGSGLPSTRDHVSVGTSQSVVTSAPTVASTLTAPRSRGGARPASSYSPNSLRLAAANVPEPDAAPGRWRPAPRGDQPRCRRRGRTRRS